MTPLYPLIPYSKEAVYQIEKDFESAFIKLNCLLDKNGKRLGFSFIQEQSDIIKAINKLVEYVESEA